MAAKRPSNDAFLRRLLDGTAHFELVGSAPSSLNSALFARIGPPLGGRASPALKKAERYAVQRIAGDGRCLFRALARGMASNKGLVLSPHQERDDADELRMAVRDVICANDEEKHKYEEALIAITVEESLKRYCQRIERSDFWGGESELLVLSKLCHQPIVVYIPEHEHSHRGSGTGFIPIAEYGTEFAKAKKGGKQRKALRLLYSGSNHYDLLV